MTTTTPSEFEVYFEDKLINVKTLSYQITREAAPIYQIGNVNPSSFSRGKRGITGSLSCYLEKDLLGHHYSIAEIVLDEMMLKVKEGIKITVMKFENVNLFAVSTFPNKSDSPEEITSMLYDMTFISSNLVGSYEYDFDNGTNEEIEAIVLRPMDDEFIELPLSLELRR